MNPYFPKPYEPFGGNFNVKADLSNYAIKANLKNATGIHTSKLAEKSDLVDNLGIGKLTPVPIDLSKLSDVVKNDVVKKTVYEKLAAKLNSFNTSGFVLKTKYDTDKSELENKIPDTSGHVKKTDYYTNITEMKDKIPNSSGLATTFALTAVANKIPSLVRKQIFTQKLLKMKGNLLIIIMLCFTTPELNKLAAGVFTARLAQENLATKTGFDTKLTSLNKKLTLIKQSIY